MAFSGIPMYHHFYQEDDYDKTGYMGIRDQAVRKACVVAQLSHQSTSLIGVGLSDGVEREDTPTSNPIITSTPHKSLFAQRKNPFPQSGFKIHAHSSDHEPPTNVEERLCYKKMMAQMDELCRRDAEKLKVQMYKQHEELDEDLSRSLELLDSEFKLQMLNKKKEIAMELEEIEFQMYDSYYTQKQAKLSADKLHHEAKEQQRQQQLLALNQQKEFIKQQKSMFDTILQNRTLFGKYYEELSHLTMNFENKKHLHQHLGSELEKAKSSAEDFNSLIEKCGEGKISNEDVEKSSTLIDLLNALIGKVKSLAADLEAEKKREEEEDEKRKREEKEQMEKVKEAERIASEKAKAASNETMESANTNNLKDNSKGHLNRRDFYLKRYQSLAKNLMDVESSLKALTSDPKWKVFISDCNKAVNTPVNAISPVSGTHLSDKFKRLVTLLKGDPITVTDKTFSASAHPLGVQFCMNLLAKKIVKQGECAVASKPDSAFAIASVAVSLWVTFPAFGDLLLAHFHKVCPYTVPIYWEQESGMSEEEYNRKLGFLYENNKKEELNKFLKRQSGVMRLYAAMIVIPSKASLARQPRPLTEGEGWRWLAAFVTLEPRADISATLLLDTLEITGYYLLSKYGFQFQKVLHIICSHYVELLQKVTLAGRGGPVTRLHTFLKKIINDNSIPPPKGVLPPNFW